MLIVLPLSAGYFFVNYLGFKLYIIFYFLIPFLVTIEILFIEKKSVIKLILLRLFHFLFAYIISGIMFSSDIIAQFISTLSLILMLEVLFLLGVILKKIANEKNIIVFNKNHE